MTGVNSLMNISWQFKTSCARSRSLWAFLQGVGVHHVDVGRTVPRSLRHNSQQPLHGLAAAARPFYERCLPLAKLYKRFEPQESPRPRFSLGDLAAPAQVN